MISTCTTVDGYDVHWHVSKEERKIRGAEWRLGFLNGRGCRSGINERLLHFYACGVVDAAIGQGEEELAVDDGLERCGAKGCVVHGADVFIQTYDVHLSPEPVGLVSIHACGGHIDRNGFVNPFEDSIS